MLIIKHRINTISQLLETPVEYGVELDLRPNGNDIIIHHEAFEQGENFEDYLTYFKHEFIILNTKAEGMENRLISLMEKHKIENYFFLDLSLPFLVKYSKLGIKKIAIRFSEFEPIEFVQKFAGKVDWVWVDCFNDWPINREIYTYLKQHFKICIVSPELQGHSATMIGTFKKNMQGLPIDAVCTKTPELWK